jgi:hypothetical protein
LGTRYWWDIDTIDQPGGITGHAWVCAPPYLVVDTTLKNQPWGADTAFGEALPHSIVLDESNAARIKPTADDVICNERREIERRAFGRNNPNLHYSLVRQLAQFERTFGAWQGSVGNAKLRYIPNAITAPDTALEKIGMIGRGNFEDIWRDVVQPTVAQLQT